MTLKFSQITASLSNFTTTDVLIGVQLATADRLFSFNQIASGLLTSATLSGATLNTATLNNVTINTAVINGFLGVGTTTPATRLDVGGEIASRSGFSGDPQRGSIAIGNYTSIGAGIVGTIKGFNVGTGVAQIDFGVTGGTSLGQILFYTFNGTTATAGLTINASGIVSVGTAAITTILSPTINTATINNSLLNTATLVNATINNPTINTATINGFLGIGTTTPAYQTVIEGTGQATSAIADAGAKGASLIILDTPVSAGQGGALLLGGGVTNGLLPHAAIKSVIFDGTANGQADLAFSLRAASATTQLTEHMRICNSGGIAIGTAVNGYPAGSVIQTGKSTLLSGTGLSATATAVLLASNVASFGMYIGTGVPAVAAGTGSIYLRNDGTNATSRMYINTNGGTTWTAVTTVA